MTNVRLDHVNVTGNDYVGGLAGELSSVTVNNCIVTGNVTGVDDIGGLTGWLDGTINDSAASVNVTGSHYHTGGLVGVNSGTINGSYASGRVSGGAIATGGLAGQQYSGSINNSYASGSVSGNSQVGGLIGIQDGGSIGNSYASGSVGGNSYVGGLSGRWTRGSNDNSFYDMESTGQSASAFGTGKLTAAMKDRSTYEEDIDHQWDFNNVWVIDPSLNNGYPDLQAMISVAASFDSNGGSAVASQTVKYNGTAAAPSIPTKNGYKFEGWYSDRELTQAFLFTTQMTSDVTLYAKWMSTNADLSNLTLSSGTLDPVFASEVTSYTASVGYAVENVTVTPTVADTTATVKVNGIDMTGSSPSGTVNLNVGANTVTVLVTAEDGATKKTYTITVTREPSSNIDLSSNADLSNLTLSSGTLDPVFASEVTSYTASVGYAVENVTVTPTVADTTATVKVNGIDVASGLPGGAVNLSVGANVITVLVTAEDGATKKTYTITVTRAPSGNIDLSSNADLSNLTLSSGTLDPVFASEVTSYTASVGYAVENVTVTPTVADTTATVKVNGTDVTSGSASGAVNLSVDANTITVLVTAEDGTQQQTYTITVTRAPSSNATLSSLTVSDVTLDPAFNSGTISYTASAANSVTSTTVTPTASDDTASVAVAVDGGAGTSITDGKPSAAIPLSVGPNTITVVVKAEDDSTTTTYMITVTRAGAGSNNNGGGFIPPSDNNVPAINGALTLPPGQAGKVSLGDAIMIAIPADATDKELRITIAKIADTQKLLTKTDVPASQVYEVAKNFPENFSKPVTLSMAFDPASLKSNQTAAVFYYDEGKQEWVEVVGGKIDGNHITVEVDHLAKFSVFPVSPVRQAGTGSVEAPTKPVITFSDISGHWAEANIKQAAGEGRLRGRNIQAESYRDACRICGDADERIAAAGQWSQTDVYGCSGDRSMGSESSRASGRSGYHYRQRGRHVPSECRDYARRDGDDGRESAQPRGRNECRSRLRG
ncbi:hypothetical protein GXP70_04875 [Paenibacillus lycopersici]|uniref:Cadherin-like beta sandwich domain-containing protein n=1 Tax=Paenibacillus lycopersici TaxID=2704462 RepID=A0A6C0FR69_9BACL|nr:cadherin-like beta sandwich domain-containing protein [Paenibacillus lycopersici]QHT59367.1 hypothetical protein GXP70_04875 [Paenibacillus lycopersici]